MNRKEAYQMAIQNEILSQNLYEALAKGFKNPDSSSLFIELITLENIHEDKLRIAFHQEFPLGEICIDADLLPFLKIGDIKEPHQILEFAIAREQAAHDAYQDLAENTADADLQKMLRQLAAEEEGHKELLLTEMQRIQGAVIWYDPSELNGLVED
jgi:rubrerythrin